MVIEAPEAPAQTTSEAEISVSVRDLCYDIDGKTILDNISFDVMAGELFGIMGMSGSGKTTLLRLMMALIKPTSGAIIIEGEDIVGMNEDELNRVRSNMGMCFQYAALFDSLTVRENVAFALRNSRDISPHELEQKVTQLLDVVDMEDTQELMPASLSGGMKKRVGIARALMNHPDLMLYDEPTSGLDPVVAGVITELIKQVRDEFHSTAVVVSHDVGSLFAVSDRVLMLHGHKVVMIDTPAEMQSSELPSIRQFVDGESAGPLTQSAGVEVNDIVT